MSTATINAPAPLPPRLLSIEEFLEQYGDQPADLVRGHIVEYPMPGVRHGSVCRRVAKYVGNFVDDHSLGHVLTNDTHVKIERNPDTARGMDVAFVSYARLPKDNVPDGALEVTPELVVEVRSPTDRWTAVLTKVLEYLDLGVTAVLVFDPKSASVTVYRTDERPATFDTADTLVVPDVLPGFAVPVGKFFE